MTLPGDVQNCNQRGTLRYRLYEPTELNLLNLNLNAAAQQTGWPVCTEGYEHFQVWVTTITLPSTLEIRVGGFHPALNAGTFTDAVIGTVTISVAGQAGSAYFGSAITPPLSTVGDSWVVGRFTRISIRNAGAALSQGINVYLEATG